MKKTFRKKTAFAWRAAGLFLLLAILWHAPLFFIERPEPVPRAQASFVDGDVYMVLDPVSLPVSDQPLSWMDPTVYLLPSDMGFSAHNRRISATTKLDDANSPPPSIMQPFQVERLHGAPGSVKSLVQAQASMEDAMTNDPMSFPPLEKPSEEGSAWRVSGRIADRLISATSALPGILSSEPLRPTVARLGVGPQGDARFVVLERSSGSEKADEAAIQFVRGIRFTALDLEADSSLEWGFVKVLWRVERPAAKP
ncbi:MAG: hypothetical protein HY360_03205 [Verrucomicrobia bacterium]|nr:hypothetical protein [Verrucomicrobiota bacterium]